MGYIRDIVKSLGEERATLKKIDESSVNRWGDAEEEVSEEKVTAVFQILSGSEEDVPEGSFDAGDLRAYIPTDFEHIVEGNVLVYQDDEYRIDEVVKHEVGREGHFEVLAKRV